MRDCHETTIAMGGRHRDSFSACIPRKEMIDCVSSFWLSSYSQVPCGYSLGSDFGWMIGWTMIIREVLKYPETELKVIKVKAYYGREFCVLW